MLRNLALSLLITVPGFACAEKPSYPSDVNEISKKPVFEQAKFESVVVDNLTALSDCDISLASINTLDSIEGAVVSEPAHIIDPDSGEHVLMQTIDYQNGDIATIKQSFCYLYNFEAEYSLKSISKEGFDLALNRIDGVVQNIQQDYTLKAALVDVAELTMNLNGFNINASFETGLPIQSVISSHYVEHGLVYKTAIENSTASSTISLYFSLGGEE